MYVSCQEEVKSLGGKFIEVEGATEDKSAGGYAVEQTEEYRRKQQELIQKCASASDVVIATAQIPGRRAPLLILKETVMAMKPGSVIVDLAASTGGNCELTEMTGLSLSWSYNNWKIRFPFRNAGRRQQDVRIEHCEPA